MVGKGFSTNIALVVVGALLIIGAFVYTLLNTKSSSVTPTVSTTENESQENVNAQSAVAQGEVNTETPVIPSKNQGATKPPVSTVVPSPSVPPAQNTTPVETPSDSSSSQEPYNPGFLASSRITPEIPSENERAILPSCEGRLFTVDPIQLSFVTSITSGSMQGNGVSDYAVVKVVGSGELNKYDLIAPGDVYITHIAQETGISADPDDATIYFALCKDVIGYVTHVKELSPAIYKMVTDSVCFGKPHVGPNACLIQKLELIGRGSLLGRVGRVEGSFGFGVIDLRKERSLSNASQYAIKTNFAACPLAYLANASGFYGKLVTPNDLCRTQ